MNDIKNDTLTVCDGLSIIDRAAIDDFVHQLLISNHHYESRNQTLKEFAFLVENRFSGRVFPILSLANNTCLPFEETPLLCLLHKGSSLEFMHQLLDYTIRNDTILSSTGGVYSDIRHITFHRDSSDLRFQMNGIDINVAVNDISMVYKTLFFEDVTILFGNNSIFKRSFLFIKAWMFIEFPRFSSSPVDQYFSSEALSVLLMSLFCRRAPIESPFQALLLFLEDYSNFDWKNYAVTFSGLGSRRDNLVDLGNNLAEIHPELLEIRVKLELICSYYRKRMFTSCENYDNINTGNNNSFGNASGSPGANGSNVSSNTSTQNVQNFANYSHSSNSSVGSGVTSPSNSSSTENFRSPIQDDQMVLPPGSSLVVVDPLNHRNLCTPYIGGSTFSGDIGDVVGNIMRRAREYLIQTVNSLSNGSGNNCVNTIPTTTSASTTNNNSIPSSPTVGSISDTISILSANSFSGNHPSGVAAIGNKSISGSLEALFPALLQKCKTLVRSAHEDGASNLLQVPSDLLDDLVADGELCAANKVSPRAVANLIFHLLNRLGRSQTVGEVGKMLQEATGNAGLMKVIKYHYRGLKRLLSCYPTLFRIGDEHSFNPLVHLLGGAASGAVLHYCRVVHIGTTKNSLHIGVGSSSNANNTPINIDQPPLREEIESIILSNIANLNSFSFNGSGSVPQNDDEEFAENMIENDHINQVIAMQQQAFMNGGGNNANLGNLLQMSRSQSHGSNSMTMNNLNNAYGQMIMNNSGRSSPTSDDSFSSSGTRVVSLNSNMNVNSNLVNGASKNGATFVDPVTGNKMYNPSRPQVWVPGKFNGNPSMIGSITLNNVSSLNNIGNAGVNNPSFMNSVGMGLSANANNGNMLISNGNVSNLQFSRSNGNGLNNPGNISNASNVNMNNVNTMANNTNLMSSRMTSRLNNRMPNVRQSSINGNQGNQGMMQNYENNAMYNNNNMSNNIISSRSNSMNNVNVNTNLANSNNNYDSILQQEAVLRKQLMLVNNGAGGKSNNYGLNSQNGNMRGMNFSESNYDMMSLSNGFGSSPMPLGTNNSLNIMSTNSTLMSNGNGNLQQLLNNNNNNFDQLSFVNNASTQMNPELLSSIGMSNVSMNEYSMLNLMDSNKGNECSHLPDFLRDM